MRHTYLLMTACALGAVGSASAFAGAQSSPNVPRQMGLKQGQWHTTIRIVDAVVSPADGKPVPDGLEKALRDKIGFSQETDDCIGWGQLPKGDLILPGIKIAADCPPSEVVADKTSLKLKAICGSVPEGFKSDVTVEATHTDVAMTAKATTAIFSASPSYNMTLSIATTSRYTGPCTLQRKP